MFSVSREAAQHSSMDRKTSAVAQQQDQLTARKQSTFDTRRPSSSDRRQSYAPAAFNVFRDEIPAVSLLLHTKYRFRSDNITHITFVVMITFLCALSKAGSVEDHAVLTGLYFFSSATGNWSFCFLVPLVSDIILFHQMSSSSRFQSQVGCHSIWQVIKS